MAKALCLLQSCRLWYVVVSLYAGLGDDASRSSTLRKSERLHVRSRRGSVGQLEVKSRRSHVLLTSDSGIPHGRQLSVLPILNDLDSVELA
jgi:hypothetical protein